MNETATERGARLLSLLPHGIAAEIAAAAQAASAITSTTTTITQLPRLQQRHPKQQLLPPHQFLRQVMHL